MNSIRARRGFCRRFCNRCRLWPRRRPAFCRMDSTGLVGLGGSVRNGVSGRGGAGRFRRTEMNGMLLSLRAFQLPQVLFPGSGIIKCRDSKNDRENRGNHARDTEEIRVNLCEIYHLVYVEDLWHLASGNRTIYVHERLLNLCKTLKNKVRFVIAFSKANLIAFTYHLQSLSRQPE